MFRTLLIFLMAMAVSICTVNINGIAEPAKRDKVFKYLLNQPFDIYLLQETHLSDVTQGELWARIDPPVWAYLFTQRAQLKSLTTKWIRMVVSL